jgi:hypothetical protein
VTKCCSSAFAGILSNKEPSVQDEETIISRQVKRKLSKWYKTPRNACIIDLLEYSFAVQYMRMMAKNAYAHNPELPSLMVPALPCCP